jgi:hypothetical protein
VFAVRDGGVILHYDGMLWSAMASGATNAQLNGVWGTSAADVFVVGYDNTSFDGVILHYDGSSWTVTTTDVPLPALFGVWGSSATDVFAVGAPPFYHYDGSSWSEMSDRTDGAASIWGTSATDVFAAGGDGIFHYDGSTWSQTLSINGNLTTVSDVWGSSSSDVFVVGALWIGSAPVASLILHFDGSSWSLMKVPRTPNNGPVEVLEGVWGSSATDVFAVGGGPILHYGPTQ